MIRFACPSCCHTFEVSDGKIGTKFPCDVCGQRLQVPAPPRFGGPRFPSIEAALAVSDRPLIVTAGTALIAPGLRVNDFKAAFIGALIYDHLHRAVAFVDRAGPACYENGS